MACLNACVAYVYVVDRYEQSCGGSGRARKMRIDDAQSCRQESRGRGGRRSKGGGVAGEEFR